MVGGVEKTQVGDVIMGESAHIEGEDGSVVCPWHWSYREGRCDGKYTGHILFGTPDKVIRLLRKDQEKHGVTVGAKREIGILMPSTFHVLSGIYRDLDENAQMMRYVGIADLDGAFDPKTRQSDEFKALVVEAVGNGATLGKLCELSPVFANVMKAARIFCKRIVAMGLVPISWFTWGKGFRVAWMDPNCYL